MVLHRWWELLVLVALLVLIGYALRPVPIVFTHTPIRHVELPQLTEQDQLGVQELLSTHVQPFQH
jgi:hypothetical protein